MKKRIFCIFAAVLLLTCLCACNGQPPIVPPSDPATQVSFLVPDVLPTTKTEQASVTATLKNNSSVEIRTAIEFLVYSEATAQSPLIGVGALEETVIPAGQTKDFTFDMGTLPLVGGTLYRIDLSLSCPAEGGTRVFVRSIHFRCIEDAPPQTERDVLKTPITDLTKEESDKLADYLFKNYIPHSYGLFASVSELSSPSIWNSVEALNRTLDNDVSDASRKLTDVLQKVERYFPGANFEPAKVRVYDALTETFLETPAGPTEEYVFVEYEIKDGTIVIYYEDLPLEDDPESSPVRYATTLKNSGTEGYFAFISSVRVGAVG